MKRPARARGVVIATPIPDTTTGPLRRGGTATAPRRAASPILAGETPGLQGPATPDPAVTGEIRILNAILSRKHGRAPEDLPPGASWSTIFRLSEDFLTASVFERLAYLDAPSLWAILRAAARPESALPARRLVRLVGLEFWPQWDAAEAVEGRARVEPDLLLRFEVGDPAEPVAILVESKIRANRQDPDQWHAQWRTWHGEETRDGKTPPRMVYLAVDGLWPGGPEATVAALTAKVREIAGGAEVPIAATATRWKDLLRAVRRQPLHSEAERRIRADIVAAFGLLGYRDLRPFEELTAFAGGIAGDLSRSLDRFPRIRPPVRHAVPALSSFSRLEGLRPLRPIGDHPAAFPRLERPHAL